MRTGHYRMPGRVAMPGSDTLAFLRGSWQLQRRLADYRHAAEGSFTGSAVFAPAAAGLRYREDGELRFGGHTGPAGRELQLRPLPGGAADVRFADGRPFYRLDLASGRWRARHPCGADDYVVTFEILAPDLVEERWRVRGPDKDYLSLTRMHRNPVSS